MANKAKVALVTGASRGIGKASALALALADAGFDVAITARTEHEGEGRTESDSVRGDDLIVAIEAASRPPSRRSRPAADGRSRRHTSQASDRERPRSLLG